MPFAPAGPPSNPQDSGTGHGFLTPEQERVLAQLWYLYKGQEATKDYADQVHQMEMEMDPAQAQWMQEHLNHPSGGLKKEFEGSLRDESLNNDAAPGGAYQFEQPQGKYDEKTGTWSETGPNGYTPPPGDYSNIPTTPPWWADARVMHASYDGVTPAKYTPHKPILSADQAMMFSWAMLLSGHNGDTVGRGRVVPHPQDNAPTKNGPERAAL